MFISKMFVVLTFVVASGLIETFSTWIWRQIYPDYVDRFGSAWSEDSERCQVSGGHLPAAWRLSCWRSSGSEVWSDNDDHDSNHFICRFYQLCLETRGGDTLCSTDRWAGDNITLSSHYSLNPLSEFLMEGHWPFLPSPMCAGANIAIVKTPSSIFDDFTFQRHLPQHARWGHEDLPLQGRGAASVSFWLRFTGFCFVRSDNDTDHVMIILKDGNGLRNSRQQIRSGGFSFSRFVQK